MAIFYCYIVMIWRTPIVLFFEFLLFRYSCCIKLTEIGVAK
ncbi:Hypothetical protein ETEE_2325 [Edwardsiella anguillarum ET080813]|uniref:Uncharacterized protein n=1 Tax=Edwardsiella anguillarum ET080813 TaxID=667120 RepID=A0A076LPX6_9GAMM|nr:Hypothetical protein ETEE_2325 [Edwardsiella anguillarum ET080813]